MKSYLSLVSEYARAHKRKHRLTIVCIAVSVMLVSTIFGMADISIKAQIDTTIQTRGNYHAIIKGISDDTAEQIESRSDVTVSDWVGVAEDTTFQSRELIVQGSGQELAEEMNLVLLEGEYPSTEQEALLNQKALEQFGLSIGDTIDVPFSGGQLRQYRITGVYGNFSSLSGSDAHGLFLSVDGIRAVLSPQYAEFYYIQFDQGVNIRRALSEIKTEYQLSEEQVSTNTVLLGLMGQSDDSAMWQIYLTAVVLFILVTLAGVLMIAGSFNRSVQERAQFFGLLRCLGASKKQIKRYIRLEGLQYCMKGIPLGLLSGCAVTWAAVFYLNMADLRFVLPEMPLLQISFPGIGAGALIGFLVVMIASRAPAKKASEVSPQAAVTGNINQADFHESNKAVNDRFHIDTSIGIYHAVSNKKSMVLTAGSIALSIILFLSFSVLIDFTKHAANPLKPYAPDISVMNVDDTMGIDRSIMEELSTLPHIKQIYGRMFLENIPASVSGQDGTATLASYDQPQLNWAEDMLISGKIDRVENGEGFLVDFETANQHGWKLGDSITLQISGESCTLPIAAILSDTVFNTQDGQWILICAEPLFMTLTGINEYEIIDLQVEEDISSQIRDIIPADMLVLDRQQGNQEVRAAYYTMAVFVYGFLLVIALVAFINILNTVNASVSNRMANYGVMRAVGMSLTQLKKVIAAEAAAYAVTGCIAGGIIGLLLNRLFFNLLVTSNWGTIWQPPLTMLTVTIFAALLTTAAAIRIPTKRIEKMSIINVVNTM